MTFSNSRTVLAGGPLHLEADVGAGDVGAGELGGGEALDFLLAGVDLRAARAGGEAGDEVVELGDLLLALLVLALDAGADAGLLEDHVVVAAVVDDDGLVVDVGDVGADVVEEVAVVRDGDDGAVVADEEVLEPVDGLEVEGVGGLVEEQGFGVAEEGLGEQDADLLAALELGHLALVEFVGDVEALQQDGGVGLGFVAVLVADDAFELAEAGAVFVGHLGLVVDDFALFEGGPEGFVAHDDGVDDAVGVEGVLVLGEDADLLGADDGALLGVDLAGEDLHEGGLAGAVGAGEAVAAASGEGDGDILEEELRAIAHGDIGDRDHLLHFLTRRRASTFLQGGKLPNLQAIKRELLSAEEEAELSARMTRGTSELSPGPGRRDSLSMN